MNEKELILEAMNKAGVPLNAGKIAELTGLDRKVVDKTMTAMKKTDPSFHRSAASGSLPGNNTIQRMLYMIPGNRRERSATALLPFYVTCVYPVLRVWGYNSLMSC